MTKSFQVTGDGVWPPITVSTFLIAWAYARYAGRRIDPQADELRARMENGGEQS